MSGVWEHPYLPCIIGGSIAVVTTIFLVRKLRKPPKKVWPRDKVILHQIGRGPWCPSLSPFPLKLETYLRMAKIPHMNDHENGMSKKSKTPWITYNDDEVADSQFCIEYLNKKLDIDLNSHLTPEQKAIGRAFQKMIEENLYWVVVCNRWLYTPTSVLRKLAGTFIPWYIPMALVRRAMTNMTNAVGMGRHSVEEVQHIGRMDMKALNTFLGNKKFLFGDRASEYDAAIFGMLSQARWQMPGTPIEAYVKEKCPNIVEYLDTMKNTYWPDWDDFITHGHTKKVDV